MGAEQIKQQQLQALVQQAVQKQKRGEKLTKAELRAIEQFEAQQNERRGTEWVRRLPKKFYAKWSGRQHKVLNEQAQLYGIPLDGDAIDVPAVVRWLHDFLAKYRVGLSELVKGDNATAGEEQTLKGQLLAEQIEERKHRNALLRISMEEQAGNIIWRDPLHTALSAAATRLRGAGDRLYKQHGEAAGKILTEALDDIERIFKSLDDATSDSPHDQSVD